MGKKLFPNWLTVGELKAKLASMEDDTRVLLPAADHSYREPQYQLETVVHYKREHSFEEYYDESQLRIGEPDEVLHSVVVLR